MHTESKWKRAHGGNWILQKDDFFISYNSFNSNERILDFPMFGSDNGSAETALVNKNVCYILNGDFREDYEKLIDLGWGECIKFFDSKPECHSSWSNE